MSKDEIANGFLQFWNTSRFKFGSFGGTLVKFGIQKAPENTQNPPEQPKKIPECTFIVQGTPCEVKQWPLGPTSGPKEPTQPPRTARKIPKTRKSTNRVSLSGSPWEGKLGCCTGASKPTPTRRGLPK